jgi:predicted phosphodiesterase
MIKHIRIVSDLHLEAWSGRNPETLAIDFLPRDDRDAESILVLAGDISSSPSQLIAFINTVMPRFANTIFIPGNHEWYRHEYYAWNDEMRDRFTKYCNGLIFAIDAIGYVELAGVRFIYTTLWGDGGHDAADNLLVDRGLNDFRLIRFEGERFTVQDMMREYKEQKAMLDEILKAPFGGKTVVITHHLPSRRLVSERFWPGDGSDGINGGFVGDCDDILAYDHAPNLWIFGHTHDTVDMLLWKTRCVANPAGYMGEWRSAKFNSFMARPMFISLEDL